MEEHRHQVPGAYALLRAAERRDPFWAPQVIVLIAIALDFALPRRVTVGPVWLLPAVEIPLLIALVIATPHPRVRYSPLRRRIAMTLIGLVSAVNAVSLILLCHYLLRGGTLPGGGKDPGRPLIFAGIALWLTNVLLFALWFWELDRGGPVTRTLEPDAIPDFLFPQMTDERFAPVGWRPALIDYLYTSLTNATAFSPTDTMPLTPTAKLLMGFQSMISLLTIGLVVARAVNILQ
jgi:hypothetical protein